MALNESIQQILFDRFCSIDSVREILFALSDYAGQWNRKIDRLQIEMFNQNEKLESIRECYES